jgi:hypothetical protein
MLLLLLPPTAETVPSERACIPCSSRAGGALLLPLTVPRRPKKRKTRRTTTTKMMMTVTRRRIGTSMLGRINAHCDAEGALGVEVELRNVRPTREENLGKVERLEMPGAAGYCRDDRRGTLFFRQ